MVSTDVMVVMRSVYLGSGSVTGRKTAWMDRTNLTSVLYVTVELVHSNVKTLTALQLQRSAMVQMTVVMDLTKPNVPTNVHYSNSSVSLAVDVF